MMKVDVELLSSKHVFVHIDKLVTEEYAKTYPVEHKEQFTIALLFMHA